MAIDLGPGGLTLGSTTVNDWADVSGGKVLQAVSGRLTTAQTFSNITNDSWQNTGVSLAITPTSSSSKILVIVNVTGAPHYTSSNAGMKFRLRRGTTDITGSFGNHVSSMTNGERLTPVASFTDLDNPSTTSATTYTVQVTSTTATSTLYVNRNYNHTGYVSSITLIEIGA